MTDNVVLLHEDFSGHPRDWETVQSSDFVAAKGAALTKGGKDGTLLFDTIDLSGIEGAKLTLDAQAWGHFEEFGSKYGDMLRIELVDQGGNVILLDMFTGWGNTLTGSETGQKIDGHKSGLEYHIPEGLESAQLRIVSDISSKHEKIKLDNVKITGTEVPEPVDPDPVDDCYVVVAHEDFEHNANGWSDVWRMHDYHGDDYLGGFGRTHATVDTQKTFHLPEHSEEVEVTFEFLEVDGWDHDRFFVFINHHKVDLGQFVQDSRFGHESNEDRSGVSGNIAWSVRSIQKGDFAGRGHSDDERHEIKLVIKDPGDKLKIGFGSNLTADKHDESWGVDDLKIVAKVKKDGVDVDAVDDVIRVAETEGAGDLETLVGGADSILDNDTQNGAAYSGDVVTVNGQTGNVGQFIDLAGGGRVKINADGTVDFDADSDFDSLDDGESAAVTVDYSIAADGSGSKLDGKLNYQFWNHVPSHHTIHNIPTHGGEYRGTVDNLDVNALALALTGDGDTYKIRYTGYLHIEQGGHYEFKIGGDDGVGIWINGHKVAARDGLHGFEYDTGNIDLSSGLHHVEIRFFENYGGQGLDVKIKGADTGGVRTSIMDYVNSSRDLKDSSAADQATVTIIVDGEDDPLPEIDAVDDSLRVLESEDEGDLETLDSGDDSILDNDTQDGASYTGDVITVNGTAANVGEFVDLAGGGRVKINADGTIDFDANGDFDSLNAGETDTVTVDYTIGSTTTNATKTNLLFVVDASGSTLSNGLPEGVFQGAGVGDVNGDGRTDTPLDAEIAAVRAAIADLLASGVDPATVTVGLVSFNTNARIIGTFALDDAALVAAVEGIRGDVNGWTDYDDALDKSIDWFNSRPADGAANKVVFLSDGVPRVPDGSIQNSSVYGNEVNTLTNSGGINADIEAIGVGGNAELRYLNDLDNTGGAVRVTDAATLTTTVSDAAQIVGISDQATVTIVIDGEDDPMPSIEAVDDCLRVFETEGEGDLETLEGGADSVLDNDTQDGAPYAGGVVTVNGQTGNVGEFIDLAGGGRVKINADGTVDFDADDDFNDLVAGESEQVTVDYTIAVGSTTTQSRTIDFSGLNRGDVVSNQIAGLTISAQRNGDGASSPNDAMIFDSANPTGGDPDLGTPNQGNILIISEDGDSSDPDDNAGGGVISIAFDNAQTVEELTFVDTEEGGAKITFTLADGSNTELTGPQTQNGGVGTFTANVADVIAMDIRLKGSGAIDDIKLTETVSTPVISDSATLKIIVDGLGDPLPVIDALDDALTVFESEGAGDQDQLNGDVLSILDNDTQDGAPYPGLVITVDGQSANVGEFVDLTAGGRIKLNADGTVDFDADNDFDALNDGESATVTVDYTIETAPTPNTPGIASDQATVTVTILGEDDPLPVIDAVDDSLRVFETEGEGDTETLDSGDDSILDNDTLDGVPYTGMVMTVDGQLASVGQFVDLTAGGRIKLNADGTVDFDADSDFDTLNDGESATVTVDYTISSDPTPNNMFVVTDQATVTVTIIGVDDPLVIDAVDDALVVSETEGDGDQDLLTGDIASILENDTLQALPFVGTVASVAGSQANVGDFVQLSGGGRIKINADGTLDFDADGDGDGISDFEGLGNDQSAQVSVEYTIEAGTGSAMVSDTATVEITILGQNVLVDDNETLENVASDAGAFGLTNVLDNTFDPETGEPTVLSVNGSAANLDVNVVGSAGGIFTIAADGTATFDTNGDFDNLAEGTSLSTQVTYTVTDATGDTDISTYTVTVNAPEPDTQTLSGTISTSGPGNQSLSFLIDHSFDMFRRATPEPNSDPNGDGFDRVIDAVLDQVIERVSLLDATQAVHFALVGDEDIPVTGDLGLRATVTTSAGALMDAMTNGTLADIFGQESDGTPLFRQPDGEEVPDLPETAVDFAFGLQSAMDFLTDPTFGFGANGAIEDEIIIITADDGTPSGGASADVVNLANELKDENGIDATIDVVTINTGILDDNGNLAEFIDGNTVFIPGLGFDPTLLLNLDSDGVLRNTTEQGDFLLDEALANNSVISAGDVVEIQVQGQVFSVLDGTLVDTNAAPDIFEFTLTDLDFNGNAAVLVRLNTDNDPTTFERTEPVQAVADPTDPDSFSFTLNIEPDPLTFGG